MDENYRVHLDDEGTSAWETVGPTSRAYGRAVPSYSTVVLIRRCVPALTPESKNFLLKIFTTREPSCENEKGRNQSPEKEPAKNHLWGKLSPDSRKKDADVLYCHRL